MGNMRLNSQTSLKNKTGENGEWYPNIAKDISIHRSSTQDTGRISKFSNTAAFVVRMHSIRYSEQN